MQGSGTRCWVKAHLHRSPIPHLAVPLCRCLPACLQQWSCNHLACMVPHRLYIYTGRQAGKGQELEPLHMHRRSTGACPRRARAPRGALFRYDTWRCIFQPTGGEAGKRQGKGPLHGISGGVRRLQQQCSVAGCSSLRRSMSSIRRAVCLHHLRQTAGTESESACQVERRGGMTAMACLGLGVGTRQCDLLRRTQVVRNAVGFLSCLPRGGRCGDVLTVGRTNRGVLSASQHWVLWDCAMGGIAVSSLQLSISL